MKFATDWQKFIPKMNFFAEDGADEGNGNSEMMNWASNWTDYMNWSHNWTNFIQPKKGKEGKDEKEETALAMVGLVNLMDAKIKNDLYNELISKEEFKEKIENIKERIDEIKDNVLDAHEVMKDEWQQFHDDEA